MDTESKPEAKRVKVEESSEPHAEPQTQTEVVQPENIACVPQGIDLQGSEAHAEPPSEAEVVQPDICVKYDSLSDFPEEILVHIFSMVENGKDLHTLSHSTRQFNRILEPSRTQWAFSEVFPLMYSTMDKDDILNCRMVCKKWKKAVDNFLPTVARTRIWEPYPYQTGSASNEGHDDGLTRNHAPQYKPCRVSKDLMGILLLESEDIRECMEKMKGHPSNPLFLRDVSFDNTFGEGEEYWTETLSFLRVYGPHIWHVSLNPNLDNDHGAQLSRNYRILREALTLMPNLRTLHLGGFWNCLADLDTDRSCLETHIRRNPLPALPHLQTFDEMLPIQPNPVMDELMRRYSGQLKHFTGASSAWLMDGSSNLNFPQVTNLAVNIDNCHLLWEPVCLRLMSPNLAKLSIIIWQSWNISDLLKPLKENFPSLVYLNLQFREEKKQNVDSMAQPEFVLEKIKTLEIEYSSYVQYEQLLNHLPRLEYVLVCRKHDFSRAISTQEEAEQENEQLNEETEVEDVETEVERLAELETLPIRILILSGGMYESDIWTRLAFLKEFTVARMGDTFVTESEIVDKMVYTRDEYILRSGQGN